MKDGPSPILILLADDDEEDRMLACDALAESRLSNHIHCVAGGEELMEYLQHLGKYAPNMPKKDGREALKEIKADPELRQIPIVVLTTSKVDEDILRSYDSGASSFISKPVTFAGLVELMKGLGRYWFEIIELPRHSALPT